MLSDFETPEAIAMFERQGWPDTTSEYIGPMRYRLRFMDGKWCEQVGKNGEWWDCATRPPAAALLPILEHHCRVELEKRRVFVGWTELSTAYVVVRLVKADGAWWREVLGDGGWTASRYYGDWLHWKSYHAAQVAGMLASQPRKVRKAKRP